MAEQNLDHPHRILSEIQKLSAGEIQAVWEFIQRLKRISKETAPEEDETKHQRLEMGFRRLYPDIPLKKDLLQWVGGVPDDGKSIGDVIIDHYESEACKA